MYKLISVLVVLLTNACGHIPNPAPTRKYYASTPQFQFAGHVSPGYISQVKKYVSEFFRDSSSPTRKLKLDVRLLAPIIILQPGSRIPNESLTAVGECIRYTETGNQQITLVEMSAEDSVIRDQVYHELGHCMLGLHHSSDQEQIMYPEVSSIPDLRGWEGAVSDLFNSADLCWVEFVSRIN